MCLISIGQTTLETALKHELSPVPTSFFQDTGYMRFAKAKSVLKANLEVQVSHRIHSSKGPVTVDEMQFSGVLIGQKMAFFLTL